MKCFETGKQIYLTPQSAHDALAKMNRRGVRKRSVRASDWHDGRSTAYKCQHCNAWHIGHAAPRRAAETKERGHG